MDGLIYENKEELITSNASTEGLFSYQCNDCKCNFLTTIENQTTCIYCGGSNITSSNYDLDNIKIIPFIKVQDEAIRKYKKSIRFNPLIPIRFKRKKAISLIQKYYFLAYVVDATVSGNVSFLASDSKKEENKHRMLFDTNFDYIKCLINVNKDITKQEFGEAFKSDFQTLQEFKLDILKEEPIIVSNYTNEEIMNNIQKALNNNSLSIISNSINHKKRKLESNGTNIKIDSEQSILVPIYFLNMKYRNKNYHYLYNGSNGNIYYKFPIGIIETIGFCIIIFGLIFLIGYLIALAI